MNSNSVKYKVTHTLFAYKLYIRSSATTLSQSELGSDDNEEVLHIPQSPSITGASPSDCLMPYPGYSLPQNIAKMQSVYSTAPANWAAYFCRNLLISQLL